MKRSYTKSLAIITASTLVITLFAVHCVHAQSSETPLVESTEKITMADANRVRVAVFRNDKDYYVYVVYALEAARVPYYLTGSMRNYEVFVDRQDADGIAELLLADSKRFRYEIYALSPDISTSSFPAIFGYTGKKHWFESMLNSKISKKRIQEMIREEEQDYFTDVASFLRNEDISKRVANALAEANIDCLFYTDLGTDAIFIDVLDVRRAIEVLTTDVQKYKYDIRINGIDYVSGIPSKRKPVN